MKKSCLVVVMFFLVLGLATGASLTQAADSITGTWRCKVENHPFGNGETTAVYQQDGEKISGTQYYLSGGKSTLLGKIQGSDFEVIVGETDIVVTGKLEGNKSSGTVDFGSWSGGVRTFSCERQ
jgi:hypothetical protein